MIQTIKFQKKPVIIEAFQITEEIAKRHLFDHEGLPFGIHLSGSYNPPAGRVYNAYTSIETTNGRELAHIGDWILRSGGKLSVCGPDEFSETYEAEDTKRPIPKEPEDIFECREFPKESHREGERVWCRVKPYKGETEYHEWLRFLCGKDSCQTEVGTRLYLSSNNQ